MSTPWETPARPAHLLVGGAEGRRRCSDSGFAKGGAQSSPVILATLLVKTSCTYISILLQDALHTL